MENNDVQHLEKLRSYWDAHHAFPSMAKLREVVTMGSTASVFEMVGRLVEAGYLNRVEGRIAPTKKFLARPVECAEPRPSAAATTTFEPAALNLLDYAMPEPGNTFFVRVPDEQLAAKGICPGDLLVMQRDTAAQTGDIVALRQGERLWLDLITAFEAKEFVLGPAIYDVLCVPELVKSRAPADIAGVAIALVRRFDREPAEKAKS